MRKDIVSDLGVQNMETVTITANGTGYLEKIDTQGYDSGVMFFGLVSAYTGDATVTVSFQDSPDGTTWTDLDAEKVIEYGSPLEYTAATATNAYVPRAGIFSNNQFIRAKIVTTTWTSGSVTLSVVAVKKGDVRPVYKPLSA